MVLNSGKQRLLQEFDKNQGFCPQKSSHTTHTMSYIVILIIPEDTEGYTQYKTTFIFKEIPKMGNNDISSLLKKNFFLVSTYRHAIATKSCTIFLQFQSITLVNPPDLKSSFFVHLGQKCRLSGGNEKIGIGVETCFFIILFSGFFTL